MGLGDDLVNETSAIVECWYKAWKRSRHPHPELTEAALKDSLPVQLKMIGQEIQHLSESKSPEDLWLGSYALNTEERVLQKVPIEEVVQEYRIAVETVRDWIDEHKIHVTFEEYSYFSSAMFELVAESIRRYAKFQTERIASERSEYLAGLTHQMRNPISAISMQLQLLAQKDISKTSSSLFMMLQRNLKRLKKFTDGVMRIERFKPDEIPVRPELIQPSQLIGQLVEDYRGDASKKGIRLETLVDHTVRIYADSELLFDSLGNLVQNAIKYTKTGFVRLEVIEEGESILFKVIDSGPGITRERQKNLFKLVHPEKVEGIGIGLTIVARAVKAQGGEVGVESEPGHGSVFWLRLPKQVTTQMSLGSEESKAA